MLQLGRGAIVLNCRADRTWRRWSSWPRHLQKCANSSEKLRDWRRRPASCSPYDNIWRTSGYPRDEQESQPSQAVTVSGVNGHSSPSLWQPWPISNARWKVLAFTGFAEKPLAELTPEMKLSAKQLYYLLLSSGEHSPRKSAESRPKR